MKPTSLTDPYFLRLSAPKRFCIADLRKVWHKILMVSEIPLEKLIRQGQSSIYNLLNTATKDPSLSKTLDQLEKGSVEAFIAQSRFKGHKYVINQLDNEASKHLPVINMNKDNVGHLYHLPAFTRYIEFSHNQDSGLFIPGTHTKQHSVEGCFIHRISTSYLPLVNAPPALQGIDPSQSIRIVELVFTGSPLGHANILDDAYCAITLYLHSPTELLTDALERSKLIIPSQWRELAPALVTYLLSILRYETSTQAKVKRLAPDLKLPSSVKCGGFSKRRAITQKIKALPPVDILHNPLD